LGLLSQKGNWRQEPAKKKWGNFSSGVIGIREIHNKKKRGKNKEEELKFNF
jgi:hypothetical protein